MIKVKFDKSRTVDYETGSYGYPQIPIEIDVKRSTDLRVRTGLDKKNQYLEDAYVVFGGSCEYANVRFTRPDGLQCLMHMDPEDAVDIYTQLMDEMKDIGMEFSDDGEFKLM